MFNAVNRYYYMYQHKETLRKYSFQGLQVMVLTECHTLMALSSEIDWK